MFNDVMDVCKINLWQCFSFLYCKWIIHIYSKQLNDSDNLENKIANWDFYKYNSFIWQFVLKSIWYFLIFMFFFLQDYNKRCAKMFNVMNIYNTFSQFEKSQNSSIQNHLKVELTGSMNYFSNSFLLKPSQIPYH